MAQVFPAIQATECFIVTPSDTVDIKDDPNNPREYAFCFLHNPSLTDNIEVRVIPAGATTQGAEVITDFAVTIGIPACGTSPLAVKRVFATSPVVAEGDVIAFVGKQR